MTGKPRTIPLIDKTKGEMKEYCLVIDGKTGEKFGGYDTMDIGFYVSRVHPFDRDGETIEDAVRRFFGAYDPGEKFAFSTKALTRVIASRSSVYDNVSKLKDVGRFTVHKDRRARPTTFFFRKGKTEKPANYQR
jgi:hypothetical protein